MTGFYWIASYPKSGNTWLRLALGALLHDGAAVPFEKLQAFAPNASQRVEVEEAFDIDSGDFTEQELSAMRGPCYQRQARNAPRPLFRKVHDMHAASSGGQLIFPQEATLGTIYLVRDPRDVVISWANFLGVELDQAIDHLCNPHVTLGSTPGRPRLNLQQRLGCWSSHVRSWLEAPGRPACVLRYEDMLQDPLGQLSKVADYIDLKRDASAMERAIEAVRFERLQQIETTRGFDGGQLSGRPFFFKGASGGWRSILAQRQIDRITNTHAAMMARCGYADVRVELTRGDPCLT